MASILDFLITAKASALFAKISEKTGETGEDVATVFGAVLPILLGAIQQKMKTKEDLEEFIAAMKKVEFEKEFLTDLNKIELEKYVSVGKDFLPQLIGSGEKFSKILSDVLDVKETSVTFILQSAAGTLIHILSIQHIKEKPDLSNMKELIRSHIGASSKFNHSLISTILDKREEGNVIQDVEGRIIGGGQNEKDKDGGVLGGMLGGK